MNWEGGNCKSRLPASRRSVQSYQQRELIAFNRQGTQQQGSASPTVTPPGMRVNTCYINVQKVNPKVCSYLPQASSVSFESVSRAISLLFCMFLQSVPVDFCREKSRPFSTYRSDYMKYDLGQVRRIRYKKKKTKNCGFLWLLLLLFNMIISRLEMKAKYGNQQ